VLSGSIAFSGGFTNHGVIHGLVTQSGGVTTISAPVSSDFNGDSVSNVLLRNSAGSFADWTMNGPALTSSTLLTSGGNAVTLSSAWSVDGVADFNGDGKADILMGNSNGTFADWTMNGSQIASSQLLTAQGATETLSSAWSVAGLGDFNGDGLADILLQNANGTFADWTMNGSQIASSQLLTSQGATETLGSAWSVAGIGDFDGDGKSDILLRNANGTFADWTMNGSQIASSQLVSSQGATVTLGSAWSVAGVGDFNGDGDADVLLRNSNGTLADWTMNGSKIASSQLLTSGGATVTLDPSWSIAALGDFNGDGKTDILLKNTSGAFVEWTMNGSAITAATQVTSSGQPVAAAAWQAQGNPTDLPFG
jgi:serralysin